MNKSKIKEELEKYKSLYRSMVNGNKKMEQTILDLRLRLGAVMQNLENANQAVQMNKDMLRQIGEEHNKKERGLIAFMNQLKAKLKEMGYNGSFDRLGPEDN